MHRVFLLLLLGSLLRCATARAADCAPRYLFFNIAPDSAWNQNRPETFSRDMFDEVVRTLHAPENPDLRIGVSFVFSTMETPTNILAQSLQRLLASSEAAGVPVLVTLDGQNWWQHRPDLWNWWDPKLPGYNPSNVFNVEWTGWSPTNAVKVGWRNWGRQHRVVPAPNLASATVRAAHLDALRALVPVIQQWRAGLGESRRLFGGLKLGWEAGIGCNAYYYPDGNRYVEQWPHDSSHDPEVNIFNAPGLSYGLAQLGYAAVKTAGIKDHGDITREDIGKVVGQYLESLCRVAHDCGLPPELVFTHQGATGEPWEQHLPFWPAFNAFSTPGWSFYGVDPQAVGPLGAELEQAGRRRWAASEWWWGGATASEWEDHFRRTLAFRDCRFICVYNWNLGMFQKQTEGHKAVRRLLREWKG